MEENRTVCLSHSYNLCPEFFFEQIRNGTLFRLTGANEIDAPEFQEGGFFKLLFNERGTISGSIIHLSDSQLWLKWNVDGFGRAPEHDTEVRISMLHSDKTELTLEHRGIKSNESAVAKERAWTEILKELEKLI